MPEISTFYGIKVTMYYNDHLPPHFHAEYNGFEALIDIDKAIILKGVFPAKQLKQILGWTIVHKDELMNNWHLAKEMKKLMRIDDSL